MISLKLWAGLLLGSLFLVSCQPYPPGFRPDVPFADPAAVPTAPREKSVEQLEKELSDRKKAQRRRAKARERAIERDAQEAVARDDRSSGGSSAPSSGSTSSKPKKKYRTASPIPGKPGFVFNPWTNTAVDVRGVPSGSLVWDTDDPNKENHRFRVP